MLAHELITDEIPPLKPTDNGLLALSWMDEFKVSQLPIVNKGEYIGLISDTEIFDLNDAEKPLGKAKITLIRPFVKANAHYYDVLKMISIMKLSLLPVLDEKENYLGVISNQHLIHKMATMSAVAEPGGIIVLELNIRDYSLTHIAQIIESNDAKILSCYIAPQSDSMKVEITLKINKQDLTAILQTFHRFNYNVKASFHQSEYAEDLKNRFDQFMSYLNM